MSTHNLGLPDPALLAQMANALFAALPGRPTVPGTAADAQALPPSSALATTPPVAPQGEFESLPVAPYVPPTSGFAPPSEVELRTAPASVASITSMPAPATASAPPEANLPYFLDPAQPGLPGVVPGVGAATASRFEAGAVPTLPSPPAAIAQPTEPTLASLPAASSEAVALSAAPYSFRPELLAAPLPVAPGAPSADVGIAQVSSIPGKGLENPSLGEASALPGPSFYFLDGAPPPFTAEPDFAAGLSSFTGEGLDLNLNLDPRNGTLPTPGVRP
jgi:cysteine desulfurase/selenocysteine lyase